MTGTGTATEAATTTQSTEPKEVVQRYLKALAERDALVLGEVLSPQVEYWIAGDCPASGTWTGHQGVLGYFGVMGERFDPAAAYDVRLLSLTAEGDTVVVECVSSTTTADGRPYRNQIVSVFTVGGGQITGMREYFDTHYLLATLFPELSIMNSAGAGG